MKYTGITYDSRKVKEEKKEEEEKEKNIDSLKKEKE